MSIGKEDIDILGQYLMSVAQKLANPGEGSS